MTKTTTIAFDGVTGIIHSAGIKHEEMVLRSKLSNHVIANLQAGPARENEAI